ncbi:hypothetical protein AB2T14_001838 [Clostridium botulinum]|uniref:hypothetical protein n=1 Tax=Clostridium sporogenes TaxID=1509 RepID=UPI00223741FA|nr:hypothetical protein [Clostridium sporogenes]MCW6076142.1 hypothetical protein [Clostridium sporogenes]
MAIAALGIVEVGLDLAVGDNTSAAVGLLCLFPMGKGIKYVGEVGGDAIKGGSKAKSLYKVATKEAGELALKGKNYSSEYAGKLKDAYTMFKNNGYDIGEHGLNRIFGRINQGKIQSVDQVFDVLDT